MSRRALEHAAAKQKQRLEEAEASGTVLLEVKPPTPESVPEGALPTHGNEVTMNFNNVLYQNIINANYLTQRCAELLTFDAVVDEIYNVVDHLQPFIPNSGNATSSGFCLLYKLFCIRLNEKEVVKLLNHPDSPYIRAIGFLYLRYCIPPKDLMDWCWDYIHDNEEFTLDIHKRVTTTIGKFVRELISKQTYFETRFPRIPVMLERDYVAQLEQNAYNPVVVDDVVDVDGDADVGGDGGVDVHAPPPVADRVRDYKSGSRDRDRDRDSVRSKSREYRSRSRDYNRDRDRDRDRDGGGRDRDRDRDRDRGSDRSRDSDSYRDRGSDRSRDSDRVKDRGRDRDRRDRDDDRNRDRGRSRDRDRDEDRDRDRDRGRDRDRDSRRDDRRR